MRFDDHMVGEIEDFVVGEISDRGHEGYNFKKLVNLTMKTFGLQGRDLVIRLINEAINDDAIVSRYLTKNNSQLLQLLEWERQSQVARGFE